MYIDKNFAQCRIAVVDRQGEPLKNFLGISTDT